jgi:hypothetical protein
MLFPYNENKVVRKAYKHLCEATQLLCCSNSPMWRVEDQRKVQALMEKFVNDLEEELKKK